MTRMHGPFILSIGASLGRRRSTITGLDEAALFMTRHDKTPLMSMSAAISLVSYFAGKGWRLKIQP